MKNDLTCEVVKDLLPSYVEGLTAEVTNQAVETHLTVCEACKQTVETMRQSESTPEIQNDEFEEQTIDALKKTRSRSQKQLTIGIASAIFVMLAIILTFTFVVGYELQDPELVQLEVTVKNQHIILAGNLKESGRGVSDVTFSNKDGVIHLSIKTTRSSFVYSNQFREEYDCDTIVSQIWLGERILWDNGDTIAPEVAKLYHSKHPYLGDMSANGRSAVALGMAKNIGVFTNELQTSEEPYGWILKVQQAYDTSVQEKIESKMRSYASALIAVIDNLSYVTFQYRVGGDERVFTLTESMADQAIGQSVKTMAKSPCGLQELMKLLNLTDGYIGSRVQEYRQKDNGTWECEGRIYKRRVVLTGRDPNAEADGRFVVLTNAKDIAYKEVSWSLISSNSADFLDIDETVIVEIGGN